MNFSINQIKTIFFSCFLILTLALCGCEDDSGHSYGDNDPNLYVALGDSITEGSALSETYPEKLSSMLESTVINEGSSGERSGSGAERVDEVLEKYKPGHLLVLYGANDIIFGFDADHIINNLRTIVRAAKANKTKVVLATITPASDYHSYMTGYIALVNPEIRKLAAEENVALADLDEAFAGNTSYLSSDGLHLSNAGAELMAETFYNSL